MVGTTLGCRFVCALEVCAFRFALAHPLTHSLARSLAGSLTDTIYSLTRSLGRLQRNMSFGMSRPIVNTLGNHAAAPVNQYMGPGGGDAWLYNGTAAACDAW